MTGLFTNTYYISSNRESGEGRYDIQLLPKNIDMPGIIIEIKATADSSDAGLKKLAAEALTQIEDKNMILSCVSKTSKLFTNTVLPSAARK